MSLNSRNNIGEIISIIAYSLILKYVLDNEKKQCECALSWHHYIIKYFTPIFILILVILLILQGL